MTASSSDLELLDRVADISVDWVQGALSNAGIESAGLCRVDYAPLGHGNTNDTYKLQLAYSGEEANSPRTLVLKIHNSDPDTALRAGQAGVYRCEHEMSSVLQAVPGLSIPRIYHSAVSEDGGKANLLVEDLSRTCVPGDQIAGLSEQDALAAVQEIIKLHAHFWRSEKLESFGWLIGRMRFHHEGAANLRKRLGSALSAKDLQIIADSLPIIDAWLDRVPEYPTLVHGDYRADNLLLNSASDGPRSVFVIDWATASIGEAISDVAYLLVSSVPTEQRSTCEEQALQIYAHAVQEIEPGYSVAMAVEAYRQNVVASMHMTMLAGLAPSSPHVEKLLETLARRNCAALRDWLNF